MVIGESGLFFHDMTSLQEFEEPSMKFWDVLEVLKIKIMQLEYCIGELIDRGKNHTEFVFPFIPRLFIVLEVVDLILPPPGDIGSFNV